MSGLTSEQIRRIEENKRKAFERLALRKTQLQHANPQIPSNGLQTKNNVTRQSPSLGVSACFPEPPFNGASGLQSGLQPLHVDSVSSNCPQRPNYGLKLGPPTSKSFTPFSLAKSASKPPNSGNSFYGNKTSFQVGGQNKTSQHHNRTIQSSYSQTPQNSNVEYTNSVIKQVLNAPSSSSVVGGTKAKCVLVSRTRFEVQSNYNKDLIELFKSMKTREYEIQTKNWSFDLSEYKNLISTVERLCKSVNIEKLPHCVLHTFRNIMKGDKAPDPTPPDVDLCHVDHVLVEALMPFQRTGVNFAVQKRGRVLIADDMGLGKTIQAICIACYYKQEWPLLIVVPSSVRFAWREQLLRWVPTLDTQEINVVVSGKDHMPSCQITIISYDLLVRCKTLQDRHFGVIIMDESHSLKNSKTARAKAAIPMLKKARRVILLSGTPALSRPMELYSQISTIDHATFPSYQKFGERYCGGKQMPWGWDFSGSSHMNELQIVLRENIMIRRLKKDVLKELPAKQRGMVVLDPSSIKANKVMKASHQMVEQLKGNKRHGALLQYFHETAASKAPAVKDYVLDLLEGEHKFLFFGHHQDMLDTVENAVQKKQYKYIRIDGRTSAEQRNELCERFQKNDDVRIAILSIMAANAGLNFTAASTVVFGELFWNPGILVQAEDRAHRMGQEDSVSIQYLVALDTADDYIWPLVQKKLDVLGKAGLTKDNFSDADTKQQKTKNDIMQYLEEAFFEDDLVPDVVKVPATKENVVAIETAAEKSKKPTHKQGTLFQYISSEKTPGTCSQDDCNQDWGEDLPEEFWAADNLEDPSPKRARVDDT